MGPILHTKIISSFKNRQSDDRFVIAISGGSLPSFLKAADLIKSFELAGMNDPEWCKWFVFLADERCVSNDHPDSNFCSIRENLLQHVPIPQEQIFPISDEMLADNLTLSIVDDIALKYETSVKSVLGEGGVFDCILLGFGPDGHTCSLFPEHPLLLERSKLVAGIINSPKPPPERITLTLKVLDKAKVVIFCGCGSSKAPILDAIFSSGARIEDKSNTSMQVVMTDPAPYPCGMIKSNAMIWVVDSDAVAGLELLSKI